MYLLLVADLATDDLGSLWKNVNMFTDTDEYKQLSNRFFFYFLFFLVYSINSCTKVNRILIQSNIAALLLITLLLLSN